MHGQPQILMLKKAGGGLIRVEINLVMSQEAPMQPASISEAAHAYNPTVSIRKNKKA